MACWSLEVARLCDHSNNILFRGLMHIFKSQKTNSLVLISEKAEKKNRAKELNISSIDCVFSPGCVDDDLPPLPNQLGVVAQLCVGDAVDERVLEGHTYMTSANFSDFLTPNPPCHIQKSADLVPFVCFLGTPIPPTQCGRHTSMVPCACARRGRCTRATGRPPPRWSPSPARSRR